MNSAASPQTLSVLENLKNKNILILGATGFVGKVLFSMMLAKIPTVQCIYLLIRSKDDQTVLERFTQDILLSPALEPLRTSHGDTFEQFIKARVKILDGDASLPNLGMDKQTFNYLSTRIDLVINSAGLVDFFPEVDRSLTTNTTGAIHTAEFTRHCANAKLVHISTCYVAPSQDGIYEEEIHLTKSKEGLVWDAQAEMADVLAEIDAINLQKLPSDEARRAKISLGRSRAEYWGFNNTYCYSKALAESILATDYDDISFAIVRPSIIESALSYPFAGWNEGFNTSAPLAFLLGGWYPYIVAKDEVILDVIPVDMICANLLLIASALLTNTASRIYQLSSSDSNPLSVKNIILNTRTWHQCNRASGPWKKIVRYTRTFKSAKALNENHPLSPQKLADLLQKLSKIIQKITPAKQLANKISKPIESASKSLTRVAKINRIFQPFTCNHQYVFSAKSIQDLQVSEPEFGYDLKQLDWKNYWINIHMPGLARWIFPKYTSATFTEKPHNPGSLVNSNLESLVLETKIQALTEEHEEESVAMS